VLRQNYIAEMSAILALVAINLAVFMPALSGDFIWDDKYFVADNQLILGPNFFKQVLLTPYGGPAGFDENSLILGRAINFYRPLTSLSYWIDHKIWGLNPAGFHLSNILIHSIAAIILYLILKLWGWDYLWAFMTSLLFLVFPPHFENVAWISGRTDLVCFSFGALSIFFASLFLKKMSFFWLITSSIFFLCSLLSKETAILLPIIFFVFFWLKEKSILKSFYKGLIFLPAFLIWFLLRQYTLGTENLKFTERNFADFVATLGFYVSRTIYPFNMSVTVDSQRVFDNKLYLIVGSGFILALFVLSVVYYSKRTGMALCIWIISYLVLLLPSIIIIFLPSTVSYIGWRFLYWPSAAALIGLMYFAKKLIRNKFAVLILVIILACFYTIELYPRAALFGKNEKDFWLAIKDIENEDILARFNIGFQYLSIDEEKALGIFENIINDRHHHMHDACEMRIYEELAEFYTFKKDFEKAKRYFDFLFRKRPVQSLHTYFNYSYFLAFQGQKEKGEKYINEMLRLFPENHLVLVHTANFYLLLKDYSKAMEYFIKDYKLFPNEKTKMFLAQIEAEIKGKN